MVAIEVGDCSTSSALGLQTLLFHVHSSLRILAFLTKQISLNESKESVLMAGMALTCLKFSGVSQSCVDL